MTPAAEQEKPSATSKGFPSGLSRANANLHLPNYGVDYPKSCGICKRNLKNFFFGS
jgi:hypothetical protein